MIFDITVSDYVEFADDVSTRKSPRGYVTLVIDMRSKTASSCAVTFESEGESQTVTATQELHTYEITLPMKENAFFRFKINAAEDIIIEGYKTM